MRTIQIQWFTTSGLLANIEFDTLEEAKYCFEDMNSIYRLRLWERGRWVEYTTDILYQ